MACLSLTPGIMLKSSTDMVLVPPLSHTLIAIHVVGNRFASSTIWAFALANSLDGFANVDLHSYCSSPSISMYHVNGSLGASMRVYEWMAHTARTMRIASPTITIGLS